MSLQKSEYSERRSTDVTASRQPPAGGEGQISGQRPKGGKTAYWIAGAVLLILLFFAIAPRIKQQSDLNHEATSLKMDAPDVSTVSPSFASDGALVLPGSLDAVEQAVIYARTSGYLQTRLVDIGSRVKAGQVLAQIESPEVDQQLLQARAESAQANAGTSEAQADEAKQQAGVAQAESETIRLQAVVSQARSAVAASLAKLAQAKSTAADSAAKLAQAKQQYATSLANVDDFEAQESIAEKTWNRYQSLAKQGAVAQQDADERESTYNQAVANVAGAKASANSAQAAIESARQQLQADEAGIQAAAADVESSRQNVGAAQAAVTSNQANVTAAQASVQASASTVEASRAGAASSQANVQREAVLRSFENVTAPFAGVITSRNVDVGALITEGGGSTTATDTNTAPHSGLFGIARTDVLRMMIGVPQTYSGYLRSGMPAQVTVREFPGRMFTGSVFQTAGALDSQSRTLQVEVNIPNASNVLLPGMFAQVRFNLPKTTGSMRIPSSALIVDAQGTRVAVVGADNKVEYVTVVEGRDFGSEVEISGGLRGNERLIDNPTDDLVAGLTVHPVPEPAAPAG